MTLTPEERDALVDRALARLAVLAAREAAEAQADAERQRARDEALTTVTPAPKIVRAVPVTKGSPWRR